MMKDGLAGADEKSSGLPLSSVWRRLIYFTAIYWMTARMGLIFVLQPEGVASLWPASGLALAMLLWVEQRDRFKHIAAIGAANFLANFTGGCTIPASLGFAAANVAEAALGCWTFYRIAGRPKGFSTIREVWGLVATTFFSNAFTALLGAAVPHFAFGAPYWAAWQLWWVADGLGMILVSPLLISWATWRRTSASPPTLPRVIEGATIILFTLATILCILQILPLDFPMVNRPYALFLLVIWMAIQFEAPGVSFLSLLISLIFLGNLLNPFGVYSWDEVTKLGRLIQMQGDLMTISVVGLVVAASVSRIRESGRLLRQEKEAMRESEERYRALVENASDIVFTTDKTGHFTFVNPAGIRIMGYGEEEVIGRHYPTLIRPDMREEAVKFFGIQFVKGLHDSYTEYPVITKEGDEIWLGQKTKLIVKDGHVEGFQAIARDITARKRVEAALRESEQRYRELSMIDDLTQLYNSRHFYIQLKSETERANRYGQPLTLLLLDLDDFKIFNDAFGHVEGDQVLSRLGQVVKRCLRETDSAYRYGGEEFTILLPMTTSAEGSVTAERIRTEFRKEAFSPVPGQEVHVTVSIGLGQYKTKEEMKAFVHRVDQLMYQGKKEGKDRICCQS